VRSDQNAFKTAFLSLVQRMEAGAKLGLDALDELPDAGEHPLTQLVEATVEEVLEHAPWSKDWAGYARLQQLRELLSQPGDFDTLWATWQKTRGN
jgi:hypothetical protein